jgi:hypothetical protein
MAQDALDLGYKPHDARLVRQAETRSSMPPGTWCPTAPSDICVSRPIRLALFPFECVTIEGPRSHHW